MAEQNRSQPLTALGDLRVLELCDEKGQYMGKLLADMGADVIKVEPPGGDAARRVGPFLDDTPGPERSLSFWYHNTSKRAITLDLERPEGQRLFKELARRADILLESQPPGYLDRLGLGYDDLSALNPRLIMTSLTPFGQTGPYRDYLASDLTLLALGGVMASCGYSEADFPDAPPIRPDGGHAWYIGCHYGVASTLVALLWRDLTGQGQRLDVSIQEAVSCTTEVALPMWLYNNTVVIRQTGRHAASFITPQTQHPTADGRLLNTFATGRDPASWTRLVEWLASEGMAEDLADPRYGDPLVRMGAATHQEPYHVAEVLGRFIARHTAEELFQGGQTRGLPWSIVRFPEETLADEHFRDRGFFVEVHHPEAGRALTYPGEPYRFSATPWRLRRRAPLVGEDNEAVLGGELGLSAAELDRLRSRGII
ncbi:MAG: CoA transferase [Dehalococcoidia bacterium]|nr:CoA transferase [Dehalococcoidia bacterium]